MSTRPALPPFSESSAIEKVRLAEGGWNSRDASKVAPAYRTNTQWRKRATSVHSREEAQAFLEAKWIKKLDYRLIKELWAFTDSRIAVRYAYEWHDDSNNWYRS
jgi:nuclear transport factor 2 (NTF2) superfamily protein